MRSLPSRAVALLLVTVCSIVLSIPPLHAVAAARHGAAPRQVVVLDPGHGGDDTGAIDPSGQLLERNLSLQVAQKAATYLRVMGYTVYLTRTRDQDVNTPPRDLNHDGKIDRIDEFDARNLFANAHHATVFVSIHFDGSNDPTKRGTHGYYCPARPFWRQSELLADVVTQSVTNAIQKSGYADINAGVQTDVADIVPQARSDYPWFLVLGPSRPKWLTGTAMPGALIESLYLSSPRDDAALRRSSTVTAIARGYAEGIHTYLDRTTP